MDPTGVLSVRDLPTEDCVLGVHKVHIVAGGDGIAPPETRSHGFGVHQERMTGLSGATGDVTQRGDQDAGRARLITGENREGLTAERAGRFHVPRGFVEYEDG